MDLASVAKTVVGVGKELLGDKGVQEFLCGTYADGTPRNISDAVHCISKTVEEAAQGVGQIAEKTSDIAAQTGDNTMMVARSKESAERLNEVAEVLRQK